MQNVIATAGFGLASAAAFGAADFGGGVASKRAHVFGVLTVARVCGLSLMLTLARLTHEPLPSTRALVWACSAGVIGGLALPIFYRALAVGKMTIAAPITSVLSAALPVLVAIVSEGWPRTVQICGLLLAMGALWLISRPEGAICPQGLGLALLAGLGFGAFLVFIRQAARAGVYWPMTAALACSLLLGILILLLQRGRLPAMRVLPFAMIAGLLDAGGNVFYVLATHRGRLDVAAVLSSLYPGFTVLLARLLLKEHISRIQAVGIAVALMSVPMIAGGL